MKKIYFPPTVEVIISETAGIICFSGNIISDEGVTNDDPINFGGIDDEGTIIPESRSTFNPFRFGE